MNLCVTDLIINHVFQALRNLHSKCLELDGVLELQITRGEKHPVVINIIET